MRRVMQDVRCASAMAVWFVVLLGFVVLWPGHVSRAAGFESRTVTSESVKKAVKEYVALNSKESGGFFIAKDARLKREWPVKLLKISDPIQQFEKDGQTLYVACTQFRTEDGKTTLDIDFWLVADAGGDLAVNATKVHSINGQARFTYEGTELKTLP